ncbi:MAG: hypothetical protein E5W09_32055 [Mesorhizobium sp.]|nr:MAG: hypothetical protein E5W09_32055 [Mesorhizobium sp.]TIX07413.1 MAG: hypothetical protein E5V57_01360 [Mesorhizobium sp.]
MPIHPWPSSSPFSPPDQQRTTSPCVPSQPLQQNQSRIVAETLVPGTSVAEAARRRNMNANMLFIWRPEVGQGRLPAVAPQPKGADKSAAMEFIPIGGGISGIQTPDHCGCAEAAVAYLRAIEHGPSG